MSVYVRGGGREGKVRGNANGRQGGKDIGGLWNSGCWVGGTINLVLLCLD